MPAFESSCLPPEQGAAGGCEDGERHRQDGNGGKRKRIDDRHSRDIGDRQAVVLIRNAQESRTRGVRSAS